MNQGPSLYLKAFGMHLTLYDATQGNFTHVIADGDGALPAPLTASPVQLKVSSILGAGRRVYWLDAKFFKPRYYSTVQQCLQARVDSRNLATGLERMANNIGDVFVERIDRPGAPPQTEIPPHPGDPTGFLISNQTGYGFISVHTSDVQIDLRFFGAKEAPYDVRIYDQDGVLLGESMPLDSAATHQMSSLNGLHLNSRLAVGGLKSAADYVMQIVPSEARQDGISTPVAFGQFDNRQ
jgi:hypothetical protein